MNLQNILSLSCRLGNSISPSHIIQNPGGGAEKEILFSLLLSSASEGTVSRRSSRPRALVARVSCIYIPT